MAYSIRITSRAERDLNAIFRYITADTSQAAAFWFNGIEKAIESLSI